MKKLLALLLCLFPSIVGAQTATGRIAASGQSTFDSIANTQTVTMVGATPSVGLGNVFKTANVGATNVTNFLNAHDSQVIQVNCGDVLTTIVNGATIITSTGSNITCTLNSVYTFIFDAAQGAWVQTKSVGSGGGSSVGNQFKLQVSNGAGGFAAGATTDNGTTLTVNEDAANCGPNPSFDLSCFGASTSTATATCSITSGTTTLTCGANDFANGNGILVPLAGTTTALTTPTQPIVTPFYILNGVTTYNYQTIAEDRNGSLTAASTVGTTTTGAATLGLNTITLTSCQITSGVVTYTSSGSHNLAAGAQVDVEGFTINILDPCNGVVIIAATPTGTTFTAIKGSGYADETNSAGSPTAKLYACNRISFASYSGNNTMRYWHYRNGSVVGVSVGLDPFFIDCGQTVTGIPNYIPASPSGATQPGWLATTVVSGGGTGSMTLALAASATVASQTTLHDNAVNLKAAVQAAYSAGGGTVVIPANLSGYVFNSAIDFTTGLSSVFTRSVKIHIRGLFNSLSQPWFLRAAMELEGEPFSTSSFVYLNATPISGNAHPMFIISEGQQGIHFSRLLLQVARTQQTGVLLDSGGDGGSTVGNTFDDMYLLGASGLSKPLITKGGFDFFWRRGDCSNGGAGINTNGCVIHTAVSSAVALPSTAQIIGRVQFDLVYFASAGVQYDCRPQPTGNGQIRDGRYNGSLFESAVEPFVWFTACTNQRVSTIKIKDFNLSDSVIGCGTPLIEATDSNVFDVEVEQILTFCGIPSTISLPITNTTNVLSTGFVSTSSGNAFNPNSVTPFEFGGLFTGKFFTPLSFTSAPTLALSAGGSVPVGQTFYTVSAVDIDGKESFVGPEANVTTTGGNQTVTITRPALPAGAVGWFAQRHPVGSGGARVNVQVVTGNCNNFIPSSTTQFVDTFSFTCGVSNVQISTAGQSVIGVNGLSAPTLRLMNSGFSLATNFPNPLTANRVLFVPDVTGMNEISSYQNSYYDNFNRANGGLGSAWTATNQTLLIASNAVPGVITNQYATSTFNASATLAPDQFCQLTITAYNSTTDAPGCALRMSGFVFYGVEFSTAGWQIIKRTAQFAQSILASGALTGTPGDVLRFEISGSMLSAFQNGTLLGTATDASLTTGLSGIAIFGNVATVDNFSTGNLHPLTHLDTEQDVIQPQHFYKGLTVGATTNPTLTRYGRYTPTLTPASVAANTCAAQSFTVTGALAADILIGINKPTEQVGLSVTLGHVSAANTATLNFCNNTASPITPTASEVYNFVVVQ